MANYMQAIAPRDGTYLAMAPNTLPMAQAAGLDGVKYDMGAFNWLGSVMPMAHSALVASAASGAKGFADLRSREFVNGASPKGSYTYTMPALLNELAGARMRIVAGYQGINTIYLALERGEVDAVAVTWNDFELEKADWIRDGKVVALAQSSPRSPTLPDTPVVEDLLSRPEDKPLVDLLLSGNRVGRPLATGPDVPAPRVAALRAAFEAMRRDPGFIEDARRSRVEVGTIAGEDIQREVAGILATPPDIARRARAILE
jgi:tripartite-type tricarboxylate transporter receptor subunit TctC